MRSILPDRARRSVLAGTIILTGTLALWACSDGLAPPESAVDTERPNLSVTPSSCGLSFTAVVTDEDALLAAYGMPATHDTLFVCDTWTGSDYVVHETRVGSAYSAWRDADPAHTVAYQNGRIEGYTAGGSSVHAPIDAGPTSFDYMQVDDGTRQASYDDPYYAVYSSGGGGTCGGYDCRVERQGSGIAPSAQVVAGSDTGRAAARFAKHGLRRRGVRALVEDAEEIGRSPDGHRRFRKRQGDAEVVLTLDAATDLLIGQELRTPDGTTTRATHRWKRGRKAGDYVRERTEIELTETVDGRPVRSRTTIELLDVTLGSGVAPSATPSTSAPRTPR